MTETSFSGRKELLTKHLTKSLSIGFCLVPSSVSSKQTSVASNATNFFHKNPERQEHIYSYLWKEVFRFFIFDLKEVAILLKICMSKDSKSIAKVLNALSI